MLKSNKTRGNAVPQLQFMTQNVLPPQTILGNGTLMDRAQCKIRGGRNGTFPPLILIFMGACRHGQGRHTCPPPLPGNVEKCFLLQMLSKTSIDEVFMHHFEKMSSASDPHRGAAPGPCWGTSVFYPPSFI